MNREILFRGKTVPTEDCESEWIVGDLLSNAYPIPNIRPLGSICCYQVIPSTVGQYIGLTDRNGVRIFEGDIVRLTQDWYDEEWQAVVEFGNSNSLYSWGWQLRRIRGAKFFNPDILLWIDMEETGATCEIIGNIHDNPELMKGEENVHKR